MFGKLEFWPRANSAKGNLAVAALEYLNVEVRRCVRTKSHITTRDTKADSWTLSVTTQCLGGFGDK